MSNLDTLGAGVAGYYGATKAGPAITSAWQNLRGADTIKSFDDLKGKTIPKEMHEKILKKDGKPYQSKKWSQATYNKAIDKFGVKDFKKAGLVNPKPSISSSLLKTGKGAGKFLMKSAAPAIMAMQLWEMAKQNRE